jgi:transcriptional regulator with XRE-family HTH domain
MTHPNFKTVANNKEPVPPSLNDDDDVRYSQAAVGHRLRAARIARGITESAAAAACKGSLRTYQKWEAGGALRNWHDQSSRLAELFDVGVTWIACPTGDPPADSVDGKITFMTGKPCRPKTSSPATSYRALTEEELLQQYPAMLQEQKMYISGAIAALASLRGGPPAA